MRSLIMMFVVSLFFISGVSNATGVNLTGQIITRTHGTSSAPTLYATPVNQVFNTLAACESAKESLRSEPYFKEGDVPGGAFGTVQYRLTLLTCDARNVAE